MGRRWSSGRLQAGADGELEGAEALREGELLLVGEILVVEYEHGVPVHAGVNGGNVVRRQRLREIDAVDLSSEAGADLTNGKGHGGVLP